MTEFKDKIEQPDKPSEIPVAQTDIPPAFDPTKMSENSATESKQFFDDIFKTFAGTEAECVTDIDAMTFTISNGTESKVYKFELGDFDLALVRAGGWLEFADAKY